MRRMISRALLCCAIFGFALNLMACTSPGAIESGKRWRNGICQQKYGRDCIDPGEPRRGPPDHNRALEPDM